MRNNDEYGGKLPGKTPFSGRRRAATRRAGFQSHPDVTGGEFRVEGVPLIRLPAGQALRIEMALPTAPQGAFVGFGGWFLAPPAAEVRLTRGQNEATISPCAAPNWSKFGSLWISEGDGFQETFELRVSEGAEIGLWGLGCGIVEHTHLSNARAALLKNMYQFAPEANFYVQKGTVRVLAEDGATVEASASNTAPIWLKACNRCARYLPINVNNERLHLSFSNHCKAEHRRPCRHAGFGRLREDRTGRVLQLEYGFQLECRFCKKFEVNAAHNPQRSAAQMKEDAARRRNFEFLLEHLYQGSPNLRYRHETGRELALDVWERFDRRCFKCGADLPTAQDMHLDHTRPLALLWPLDGTATALCARCNSQKRDRPPAEFYTEAELARLSEITGVPLDVLRDPTPNLEAIARLRARLDWFFSEFLTKPELVKVRDGKTAGELLVKALQKVINRCPRDLRFDLEAELEARRAHR